jgi:low affinity Fe/Cu permease
MFTRFCNKIVEGAGSPWSFLLALIILIVWASLGPVFHWSEMHSLFINTFTTIITFLMVFLIQHSQNKNEKALHAKIDELIRSIAEADNSFIKYEEKVD